MPGLTVTEKEHWKDRIQKRIERRIESVAAADPGLLDRVRHQARAMALKSLGLAEAQAELDGIAAAKDKLEKRERLLQREMVARVRGVTVEDLDDGRFFNLKHEVDSAVGRRLAVHEDELLAQEETGRLILQLRAERDNLLDTVWLATSPKQIKELWSKVAELLGDGQTTLQREALAIAPVEE